MSTAAEIAASADSRFENARKLTFWSFCAAALAIAFVPGFSLLNEALDSRVDPVLAVTVEGTLIAFLVFYCRVLQASLLGVLPIADLVWSGALALGLTAMMFIAFPWVIIGPLWAAGAAMCLRNARQIVWLCIGTGAVVALFATPATGEGAHWYMWPAMFALLSVCCGLGVLGNMAQKSMWDLFKDAHEAREAQSRLAVAEERLRIARDLHDLLGHNLSLIAVKSELAVRLAGSDAVRAQAEMTDVRRAAREALREVRATVRGYRDIEFDAELASVRAVLEAADVRCAVSPVPPLPPAMRSVLAWVVREGTTNVLKHSSAQTCEISVELSGDTVLLTMSNDHAHPPASSNGNGDGTVRGDDSGTGDGTGLIGMRERVTALGGTLTGSGTPDGGFLLRAVLPLQFTA